ncbi:hypothetical protein SAMN05216524_103587 [Mucilaginibacter sp. OK098]|nr:hypothetical protein SAMN05216524_103587 [Mucilaginibacter sp. OK098]
MAIKQIVEEVPEVLNSVVRVEDVEWIALDWRGLAIVSAYLPKANSSRRSRNEKYRSN